MGDAFVLVHGAWHGGWCWRPVAERLRAHGHAVTTPTLSGLGERAHLLSERIDLETCIADIVNHIDYERLEGVVLIGHSFGGVVIEGVADRIADRLRRLISLDGVVLESGESAMSQVPPAVAEARLRAAADSPGGLTMPPPPASAFGIADANQARWVEDRLTPHPLKTYVSALHVRGRPGNGLPVDYIACSDPLYAGLIGAHRRAEAKGWRMHDLPTAHDAMVTAPLATADLLAAIAAS